MNPGKNNFTVSKDGGEVDAITASTITIRAFLRAIHNAYTKVIAGGDVVSGATQQASAVDGESGATQQASAVDGESGATQQASAADMGTPEVIE